MLDVAASVEVHFENKDGGFFLKHTPRQYYPSRSDGSGLSTLAAGISGAPQSQAGSILSVDKFTVFQTSEPVSIRATYGPFSTKQTVPARYIVPDPLDDLPPPDTRRNLTIQTLQEAQELGSRHLDMSAHLVEDSVRRDSPVLRVLFHAGSETGGRRQLLLSRHQRVCVVLHATYVGSGSRMSTSSSSNSNSSSGKNKQGLTPGPLTAACSPDGEDGVCLAQVTIPADWWPPLPAPDASGRLKVTKSLPRYVQVSYSVLEPRLEDSTQADGGAPGAFCRPRVQIQPVTPLGQVPLEPNKSNYNELKADDSLTLLIPHRPLYPRSRIHVPVFLQPPAVHARQTRPPLVTAVVLRARVKSGVRILGASSSSPDWILLSEINTKNTAATFTISRKENVYRSLNATAEEILSILLEASEEGIGSSWDGGRIVWSVRYVLERDEENILMNEELDNEELQQQPHHHHHVKRKKLQARLEIQKDDIQAVLPISKNWEVMNTAVLTGRQVSQGMKVFIVSQAGKVADVTLQSSCHSEDESVLKVSSSCSSVYVDGSEIRGSSNASVLVKYGTYTGLAKFTVWMPEFPLEVSVADIRLSQIKGWKVPEEHTVTKNKRSLNATTTESSVDDETMDDGDGVDVKVEKKRSAASTTDTDPMEDSVIVDEDDEKFRSGDSRWDDVNSIDRGLGMNCKLRFQQSPVEVHARFLAADHDSGRVSYFVNRRTWLRVTDLIIGLLRISDPRIATLLQGRIVQGRQIGRTEVQVVSPITSRVIGAKEIRIGNDRVTITKLSVRVISGLQLTISPDSAIENGYIAETLVTRRLTAQYQEGLLDIDMEFSDGSRTPLREIAVSDYHLQVDSLDTEVVAFAPMVASHHPRVIAVGEGRGDLLRVTLQLADACRLTGRRAKSTTRASVAPLATALANVEVDFASSDLPSRPEFVQNDGGGSVGSHHHRERKNGRGEVAPDLHDILIGGMGGVGVRHHSEPHMSPLEIGMYVLLAVFCFAIVVFVVSCVVYASKFKPQPSDLRVHNSIPMLGAARAAASQLAPVRRPRESTTNAHDWVWLGRATLERAACAPQQVRVTSNPLAAEDDENGELRLSFDNPNHIELPSTTRSTPIDSTTYCKRDRYGNKTGNKSTSEGNNPSASRNDNEVPPPLPPHGVSLDVASGAGGGDAASAAAENSINNNEDYKPPVPPHRNAGMASRLPETPRKHRHRSLSSGHRNNHQRHAKHAASKAHKYKAVKTKETDNLPSLNNEGEEEVEMRNSNVEKRVKPEKSSRDIKRATIVGNPMFSSFADNSSSGNGQKTDESVALDDLNLDMDYNQIMQYFDNLKESNA